MWCMHFAPSLNAFYWNLTSKPWTIIIINLKRPSNAMESGAELNPKVLWKHCLIQLFNYLTLFTQVTLFLVWFFPERSPIFATGILWLIRGKEKMPERALPGWELLAGWSNSNSNFVSNWIEVQCRASALHNVLVIKRERGEWKNRRERVSGKTFPQVAGSGPNSGKFNRCRKKNWAGSHRTWQKILSCWKKWPFPILTVYVEFCPRFGPWGY